MAIIDRFCRERLVIVASILDVYFYNTRLNMSLELYFAKYKNNLYHLGNNMPNKNGEYQLKLSTVDEKKMLPEFTRNDDKAGLEVPSHSSDVTDIFSIKISFEHENQNYNNHSILSFSFEPGWPSLIMVQTRNGEGAKAIPLEEVESFTVSKIVYRKNGCKPEEPCQDMCDLTASQFEDLMKNTYNLKTI